MRKILLSASLSLAGLMFMGVAAWTHPIPVYPQSGQSQAATKSVAGKVTSIGDGGHSFAVEANEGDTKPTIQFVVNDSTQVKGKVTVGTAVTVEYQAMESGENLARSVTAQG